MSGIVYSELANWDGGYSVSGSQAGNTREPSAVSDSGSPAPASDLTSALETAFAGHDVSGASELAPVASGSSSAATIYSAHPLSGHGATERMSPQDARRSGGFAAQNGRLDAAKKVSARRKDCESWRWEIDCYHRVLRGYFSARPITSPRRHAKLQFSPPSARLQDNLAFLLRDSAARRRAKYPHTILPIPQHRAPHSLCDTMYHLQATRSGTRPARSMQADHLRNSLLPIHTLLLLDQRRSHLRCVISFDHIDSFRCQCVVPYLTARKSTHNTTLIAGCVRRGPNATRNPCNLSPRGRVPRPGNRGRRQFATRCGWRDRSRKCGRGLYCPCAQRATFIRFHRGERRDCKEPAH